VAVTHPMTDTNTFTVMRHSGRRDAKWRTVYSGDWQTAGAKYDALALDLRQGGVKLICSCGDLLRMCSAPTLRTKW
jgi:hypothetical protein